MFKTEENKLDWIYKDPSKNIDREEYILGRSIDKTLEQLNDDEKQKQNPNTISKSRVEHECIPPSIRDFNKIVQAEQVDLSTKLQEDPLVAIKKREEETRKLFLQNPVQLKKLQKALKAQQLSKEKKKKKKKKSKELTKNLDTILMHKFNELKQYLSDSDLQEILAMSDDKKPNKKKKNRTKSTSSSSGSESESDSDYNRKRNKNQNKTESGRGRKKNSSEESDSDNDRKSKNRYKPESSRVRRSPSSSSDTTNSDDDDDDSDHHRSEKKRTYGLVRSDGSKVVLKGRHDRKEEKKSSTKKIEPVKPTIERKKKLTDEEKEKIRQEMLSNASRRDRERERNLKKHREEEERESKQRQEYDEEFIHKQMMRTGGGDSLGSAIRSKLSKIQRSSKDMSTNFSKR